MDTYNIFAKRIKNIRTSHNLSMSGLAMIINVKSSSNISDWEKGTLFPSLELSLKICRLFGISLDWLLGLSDEPYTDTILTNLESNILPKEIIVNGSSIRLFNPTSFPYKYMDLYARRETYSMAVRANIIYLLNLEMSFLSYAYLHNAAFPPKIECRLDYFSALKDEIIFQKKQKLHRQYTDDLLKLLYRKTNNEPIFALK